MLMCMTSGFVAVQLFVRQTTGALDQNQLHCWYREHLNASPLEEVILGKPW
ncbi:hypothetical protein RchiOBHm_Chr3g0450461 [Rosa chinensis]|uniref:Uncharacterized protein n=1 Tax=Rosa chinensis TaxID=74649 RepID=A0A2P6R5U3_ROSCH|nr:hypothetical protein RchiOBHm_Chr3g0450461 [Rosa chinensis]